MSVIIWPCHQLFIGWYRLFSGKHTFSSNVHCCILWHALQCTFWHRSSLLLTWKALCVLFGVMETFFFYVGQSETSLLLGRNSCTSVSWHFGNLLCQHHDSGIAPARKVVPTVEKLYCSFSEHRYPLLEGFSIILKLPLWHTYIPCPLSNVYCKQGAIATLST